MDGAFSFVSLYNDDIFSQKDFDLVSFLTGDLFLPNKNNCYDDQKKIPYDPPTFRRLEQIVLVLTVVLELMCLHPPSTVATKVASVPGATTTDRRSDRRDDIAATIIAA